MGSQTTYHQGTGWTADRSPKHSLSRSIIFAIQHNYGVRIASGGRPFYVAVLAAAGGGIMEKVTLNDAGVAAICSLFAFPLCEASWHAIVVEGEAVAGLIGLLFGVPLGVAGLTFHWWKDSPLRQKVQRQVLNWWPAGAFLAFVYIAGPEIYNRFQSWVTAGQVEKMVQPIRSELERTRRERDEAQAKLSMQAPPPPRFVTNAAFSSTRDKPLTFSGTAAILADRLHIYGKVARGMGANFGTPVELAQVKNPSPGSPIEDVQLIFKSTSPSDGRYYFGAPRNDEGPLRVMNTIALEIYPPGRFAAQTICSVVIHTAAERSDPIIIYAPEDTANWVAALKDCRK
jgi:hypothetical protein